MGMFDRLKKINSNNDNYSDNYEDYYEGFDNGYEGAQAPEDPAQAAPQTESHGFNYTAPQPSAAASGMSLNGAAIELKVVKPSEFKDGPSIAEHLLNKRTVVLNLEDTDKDTSRRLIDFLFGVAYSIGGEIKKVANNAYVITPQNVAISNDKAQAAEAPAAHAAPAEEQPLNGFYN